jgi:hypothetical protein
LSQSAFLYGKYKYQKFIIKEKKSTFFTESTSLENFFGAEGEI